MDTASFVLSTAHELHTRSGGASQEEKDKRPGVYKLIGLALAIVSGVFIGSSFVLKKTGLLKANVKYKEEAGEGYGYLKNAFWWSGMTLMIVGEVCNFAAYMFADAILVTPLGALSVVICTILSAIFLKERLSFVGKVGCFMCIVGSVVIALNAPEQNALTNIQDMQRLVISPGFLSYTGVIIFGCVFIALWVGPRYGKKSMLVYLSICSLIGGLSVVATQGFGAAITAQIRGPDPQFKNWFIYVLLAFVITTLITEIIYLNKALNIFNAALVTPTYYVFFTSATIVTSAVLFRGFAGDWKPIVTMVLGFLQICAGVVLLQLSKSSKDVPDATVFSGDLDQVRTVAEQEEPESEPKADAIRGAAAIIRRISMSRQKMEAEEAKRVHEERLRDQMEPIGENERVEWDGLRRRKTVLDGPSRGLQRRKTLHPPLGMAYFPDDDDIRDSRGNPDDDEEQQRVDAGFMNSLKRRAQSSLHPGQWRNGPPDARSPMHPVPLTDVNVLPYKGVDNPLHPPQADGSADATHAFGLPQGLNSPRTTSDDALRRLAPPLHHQSQSSLAPTPPLHSAKRQFSFQNAFKRRRSDVQAESSDAVRPVSRSGLGSRSGNKNPLLKSATEEERLGLVKGDSTHSIPPPDYDDGEWQPDSMRKGALSGYGVRPPSPPPIDEEEEVDSYGKSAEPWSNTNKPLPEARNLMPLSRQSDEDNNVMNRQRPRDREGHSGGGPAFI
ncbi:MAG: hypothetical protein LQ339_008665 [Xanthoria mediterranea]|nr:MAG: hypothetical protein LQ339_008665 [Xanthoria mediterranea]